MGPGELVRTALESLNTDVGNFYAQLADDVSFEPFGIVGVEACRSMDGPFFDAFTSHHRVVERLIEDGDNVYVWLRFTGTRADGTVSQFETNNHYLVRNGKIVSMRMFFDTAALAADLAN
jgi:ketosteroid isomerase-like protein